MKKTFFLLVAAADAIPASVENSKPAPSIPFFLTVLAGWRFSKRRFRAGISWQPAAFGLEIGRAWERGSRSFFLRIIWLPRRVDHTKEATTLRLTAWKAGQAGSAPGRFVPYLGPAGVYLSRKKMSSAPWMKSRQVFLPWPACDSV